MLLDSSEITYDYDTTNTNTQYSKSFPAKPLANAFTALSQIMKECLFRRGKPLFHVVPIPCGGGKSALVQTFISDWKSTRFEGGGSVIVMLSTLEEVDSYISGAGLGREDYACLSPDQKYSGFGIGRGRAGEARILFVTHEQARRRMLEHNGFEAVEAFHYHGEARSLRIWDEGITPAVPVSFKLSHLEALPDAVRLRNPHLADMIEAMRLDNADRNEGHMLFVPIELGRAAGKFAMDEKGWLAKPTAKILEGLFYLAGRHAILKRDNWTGLSVIGTSAQLPDDLAPLIILDASAEHRHSYRLWANRTDNVIFLPPVPADYSHLTIYWFDKGANKSTLLKATERLKIVAAVADAVETNPCEEWLIIHAMEVEGSGPNPGFNISEEIEKSLSIGSRLTFLHWGRHLATNDYKRFQNVIIIGSLNYGQPGYEALCAAATGKPGPFAQQEINMIARGEFVHHVYQAACRSNLRNIVDGVAGAAKVFLIAPDRKNRQTGIEAAFKGCVIEAWEPIPPLPKPREQHVIETMARLFEGRRIISVQELWQACGGTSADYLRRIWTRKAVTEFMKIKGIKRKGNKLLR